MFFLPPFWGTGREKAAADIGPGKLQESQNSEPSVPQTQELSEITFNLEMVWLSQASEGRLKQELWIKITA